MTTDKPIKSWIEERRAIIQGAREAIRPAEAIDLGLLDLPRALDALEQVLGLHEPINGFVGDPSHWECSVCSDERGPKRYPCPTVQAIEGVINE